ncbi:hypothetical protein [uncultured Tyzzerella sp.]|uniref:hypothetical protein n=1 Tax=uncultured Tyzzerella sp. TaxID=2321398 RepID=UPI002943F448|nr:hypothetical protein [uncultured Tyzzerella sp.]
MLKIKETNRNIKIKVLERTSSGVRFLDLKGKIIKTEYPYIYIKGYTINTENIVKWQEI